MQGPVEGSSPKGQFVSLSVFSVDTFFFISGFLVSYLFYKGRTETRNESFVKKLVDFILGIVRRYARLTPAYMFTISLSDAVSAYLNTASSYYISERPDEICPTFWWRNILYINNLFPRDEMCLSWSWYLANDMQFYVISSALMYLSTSFFKTSATILITLGTVCMSYTVYVSYSHDYLPTMDDQYMLRSLLYDPPWARISPYLIGVCTGYLHLKLDGKLSLNKFIVYLLWLLCILLLVALIFGTLDKNVSTILAAIYVSFGKAGWGVCMAWIVIACSTGNGGVVEKVLSWPAFVPASRLTYCAYLLNPIIISFVYYMSEVPGHLQYVTVMFQFISVTVVVMFLAYVMSLLLETPNLLLIKLVLGHRKKKTQLVEVSKDIASSRL